MGELSKRERNLLFALKKTVADAVKAEVDDDRAALLPDLVTEWRESGAKGAGVYLPAGEKVATLTLTEKKPTVKITDPEAFAEWLADNRPDLALVEVVPAVVVPAHTVAKPSPGALDALTEAGAGGTPDGDFLTAEGEPIPGVTFEPPGAPSSFSVRYEGGKRGAARLLEAWRSGELSSLDPGAALPQIGAGE
jgi:hypothetical protein